MDTKQIELRPTTLKNYKEFLERLIKNYGENIDDSTAVIKYIYSIGKSKSNEKMYFLSLFHHFKDKNPQLASIYKEQFTKITKDMSDQQKKQLATENEKEKYLDYSTIQSIAIKAIQDTNLTLEDKLLIGFYGLMPPVRRDYHSLSIYNKNPKDVSGNYIVMGKNPTVYITDHKTSKYHGTLVRKIPAELVRLLKEWRRLNPDKRLFDKTVPYLAKKVKNLFQKFSGKSLTINIIRHSFINHHRGNEMPLEKKEELANLLGHSVSMNELYRRIDI